MNIETTPSLLDIKFELPSDWFIVLDTNRSEAKSCVFGGVLVIDDLRESAAGASIDTGNLFLRFDPSSSSIVIARPPAPLNTAVGIKKVSFEGVSASVAKMIENCMRGFMQRYMEVKSQMTTRAVEDNDVCMVKKCSVKGKYSIYQMGADGGSGGLVIIVRESELRVGKIISGISLVECGKTYPIMIITVSSSMVQQHIPAIYNVEFTCLIGGYCIGTLSCLNPLALRVCKEKIQEYFGDAA